MADERDYITMYGFQFDDWDSTFGGTTFDHHLVRNANTVSPYVMSTTSSVWVTNGVEFIYPHHIKRKYFLEGVVEGEVTFGHNEATVSQISDYRVTIFKLNTDTTKTDLATTGVVSVTFRTSSCVPAGDGMVFHYYINVYQEPKVISEFDRIGIRIEWNKEHVIGVSETSAKLLHELSIVGNGNYDLWADLPLILGD